MLRLIRFTITEVVIIIVCIAILTAVAINRTIGTQAVARDSERSADIDAIASKLESWYNGSGQGRYPSTAELVDNESWILANLKGIDPMALRSPNVLASDPPSIVTATNNVTTISGVTPQPTVDKYVYQPIAPDDSLCTNLSQKCLRFALYYRSEVDDTVHIKDSLAQ
jgi:type II secretory pathway pseudopilin PulG